MAPKIASGLDDSGRYQWNANELKRRFLSEGPLINFEDENVL